MQAGFRTRHTTTVAITAVCRNVTHSADLHAKVVIPVSILQLVVCCHWTTYCLICNKQKHSLGRADRKLDHFETRAMMKRLLIMKTWDLTVLSQRDPSVINLHSRPRGAWTSYEHQCAVHQGFWQMCSLQGWFQRCSMHSQRYCRVFFVCHPRFVIDYNDVSKVRVKTDMTDIMNISIA